MTTHTTSENASRTRALLIGALILAVGVLAAVVWISFTDRGDTSEHQGPQMAANDVWFGGGETGVIAPALSDIRNPSSSNSAGGVLAAGNGDDGDVVVNVFYDPMCPWCARFEETFSAELRAEVDEGGVTVIHHPVAFLDRMVGGTYSTRAANALAWVADQEPENFLAFVHLLMAHQPGEDAEGLSDARIAELAVTAGVSRAVADRFTDIESSEFTREDGTRGRAHSRTFAPWVAAATQQAAVDLGPHGGLSTPTILVNGVRFETLDRTGSLADAIDAARG